MSCKLLTIGQLPQEILVELLLQYDAYIIEFFDDCRHEDGDVPVCVHEFYENEFLGYAEEKEFSWKLYDVKLQYSFKKREDFYVDIIVGELMFTVVVPDSVYNSDADTLIDYIEENHGETIFNIMNAGLEANE